MAASKCMHVTATGPGQQRSHLGRKSRFLAGFHHDGGSGAAGGLEQCERKSGSGQAHIEQILPQPLAAAFRPRGADAAPSGRDPAPGWWPRPRDCRAGRNVCAAGLQSRSDRAARRDRTGGNRSNAAAHRCRSSARRTAGTASRRHWEPARSGGHWAAAADARRRDSAPGS